MLVVTAILRFLKPGGRIPDKRKNTLCVKNVDLSCDVIMSDTAGVKIPELYLELASGNYRRVDHKYL
ncbi:putative Zinc finger, ZPR1-type [Rosa chinensis]|uniref:Putative Zinc finger, ZPR1-type n=1 Tax=Rosa chinensis TaxID=74649 RepID=A0A2P6Q733_ROSCH|nr:putative Zinc finger, ZPR1-type [Rosa chinensis]